jgi:hypothetical protein
MRWFEQGEDGYYWPRDDGEPLPAIPPHFVDESECDLCVRFTLVATAYRRRSGKHAPLVGMYINAQGESKRRGSDRAERIYAGVEAYRYIGWTTKQACLRVAELLSDELGQSARGRPTKRHCRRDAYSNAQTVRSIHNKYKGPFKDKVLENYVGMFWSWREWVLQHSDPSFSVHLDRVTREFGAAKARELGRIIKTVLERYKDQFPARGYFPPDYARYLIRMKNVELYGHPDGPNRAL